VGGVEVGFLGGRVRGVAWVLRREALRANSGDAKRYLLTGKYSLG